MAISVMLVINGITTAADAESRTLGVGSSEGSGFASIGEALAAASDGDTIVVEPGAYQETLRIDKDVEIRTEGTRDLVILFPPRHASAVEFIEYPSGTDDPIPLYATIEIHGASPSIKGLTVFGPVPESRTFTTALWIAGGAPTLEDLMLTNQVKHELALSIVARHDSAPTIRDSEWIGDLFWDGAAGLVIEDCTIRGATVGLLGDGAATLRNNSLAEAASIDTDLLFAGIEAGVDIGLLETSALTLENNEFLGGGVRVTGPGPASITGNRFFGVDGGYTQVGVEVAGDDAMVDIEKNHFVNVPLAVRVENGRDVSVERNEFVDSNVAVAWYGEGAGSVADNVITGGVTGIAVEEGAPSIVGNTIENASSQGIAVSSLTSPTIEGNSVCGSRENLSISRFAEPVVGENDICIDEPAS
jgi:hypothetical protein